MVVVTLSAVLLATPRAEAFAQDKGTPVLRHSEVRVLNTKPDSVRVELRIGRFTNCAANDLAGIHTVKQGKGWTIKSPVPICYRVDPTFNDQAPQWSPWLRRVQLAGRQRTDSI